VPLWRPFPPASTTLSNVINANAVQANSWDVEGCGCLATE
jgi:hypothetical protein